MKLAAILAFVLFDGRLPDFVASLTREARWRESGIAVEHLDFRAA